MLPQKTQRRYEPKIYGFRVHASAALMRWQEEKREEMKNRLRDAIIMTGFEEEDGELDDDESDLDGDQADQDGIDDMFEAPTAQRVR